MLLWAGALLSLLPTARHLKWGQDIASVLTLCHSLALARVHPGAKTTIWCLI